MFKFEFVTTIIYVMFLVLKIFYLKEFFFLLFMPFCFVDFNKESKDSWKRPSYLKIILTKIFHNILRRML